MTDSRPSTTIQVPGGLLACVLDLISGQIKATTTGDATVIINFELPIEMIQFLMLHYRRLMWPELGDPAVDCSFARRHTDNVTASADGSSSAASRSSINRLPHMVV